MLGSWTKGEKVIKKEIEHMNQSNKWSQLEGKKYLDFTCESINKNQTKYNK